MTNAGTLLQLIIGALAVLGVLIGGFGYYRNDALRKDVSDRNVRIAFLDDENTRKDTTIKEQSKLIHDLETKVGSLEQYRDAQAGPLLNIAEQIKLVHELVTAHAELASKGFAVLEQQNADRLRMEGDRRVTHEESVIREVGP